MLPFGFQCASHKAIFRLYCPITAFCPLGLISGPFDLQTPLGKGGFMVADIMPGPDGSYPGFLTRVGDRLYFAADDGVHGRELWMWKP